MMNYIQDHIQPSLEVKLKENLLDYKNVLEKRTSYIHYINLYQKNLNLNRYPDLLDEIRQIEPIRTHLDISSNSLLYYGFIIAQPGNRNQKFHLDYKGKTITYFIPMVDMTIENGTEYLYFYNEELYKRQFSFFLHISSLFTERSDIIEALESIHLTLHKDYEFRYAQASAYSVIELQNYVFHRGRVNETNQDRILFQITIEYEPVDFIINNEFIAIAEQDE